MMNPSICIIGVYFGKMATYFPIWLKSVEANESISFLIITDQVLKGLPKNVTVVSMTLAEFKRLAEEKLGFAVSLERPYKCCDFKPAYGLILKEYIDKYDYWAHCDFDMVFGDIRSYFNTYSLSRYDKVLNLGHLSFYKNTLENNTRFMLSGSKCGDYKKIFTSNYNYAFDELNGVYSIYKQHGFSMFDTKVFADISKIHKRYTLAKSDDNYNNQVFVWEKGKVNRYYLEHKILKRNEYIYIHFKERGALPYEPECLNADAFFVTNRGFFALDDKNDITRSINRYNRYYGCLYEKFEKLRYHMDDILFRIKRKLGANKLR